MVSDIHNAAWNAYLFQPSLAEAPVLYAFESAVFLEEHPFQSFALKECIFSDNGNTVWNRYFYQHCKGET